MMIRNNRGFTLIEVIVVSAIIAILAGILVPLILNQIEDSKLAKANADIKTLQTAISAFRANTNLWPNRVDGADPTTNTVEVLFTAGNMIASAKDWPVSNPVVYKNVLGYLGTEGGVTNSRNYPAAAWKGPYLPAAPADPWGNTYLIGAKNFESATLPVWIISAGPDGIIQTPISDTVCYDGKSNMADASGVAVGDDICLRIK